MPDKCLNINDIVAFKKKKAIPFHHLIPSLYLLVICPNIRKIYHQMLLTTLKPQCNMNFKNIKNLNLFSIHQHVIFFSAKAQKLLLLINF